MRRRHHLPFATAAYTFFGRIELGYIEAILAHNARHQSPMGPPQTLGAVDGGFGGGIEGDGLGME